MLRLTLRGMAARKLRVVLTGMAVVLGVAMIAGTYVLTDTTDRSFEEIFDTGFQGTDVAITPKEIVEQEMSAAPAFSAAVLDRARAVPGVADAEGSVFDEVSIVDDDGDKIGATHVPHFAASTSREPFEAFEYVDGRAPRTASEAGVDRQTADEEDIEIGELMTVSGDEGAKRYRVTGIAKFGETDSLAGASVVTLTLSEAQRVLDKRGRFDQVSLAAEEGVSPDVLAQRVKAAMPADVNVRTGIQEAERQANDASDDFAFVQTALLAFGGIALFVGAFIIYNTFSITVAQRTRELGLLRALGASRRQVRASVLLEGLVIGILASATGLVLGAFVIAPGLQALFELIGGKLPETDRVLKGRTIVVALLVGVLVTLLAGLSPARRATRVAPIAALREGVNIETAGMRRRRLVLAIVLTVGGLGVMLSGLFGGGSAGSVAGKLGGGAAALFLAVALISPRLVRPLASAVGWPLERVGGLPARLARENATRNPGRTAVTAAALMVGLALVTFVTIFAAGAKSSVEDTIERSFAGDLVVQHDDGFSDIPGGVAAAVSRVQGVESATAVQFADAEEKGDGLGVTGIDPATFARVYDIDWTDGDDGLLARLGPTAVLAEQEDHDVGDRIEMLTPTGARLAVEVIGTYEDRNGLLGGGIVVPKDVLATSFDRRADSLVLIETSDEGARARIDRLVEQRFPTTETLDQEELKDSISDEINQLVSLIYVLLSLSVLVSLFGIVNTLALSIHERTRELGLLRAVGASRRQVRRIVRYESVITALIGASLGLVLGTAFAWLIAIPLTEEGFSLSFPILTLVSLAVLAALAGVVAAIGPARRASRVDVLRAVSYE